MSKEEGKQEEKFGFTSEGESLGYIGLNQARLLAMQHARENTGYYTETLGATYAGVNFVWELVSQEENEDYYEIKLSFRPAGRFSGKPGLEHFVIDKLGHIEMRQILGEPSDLGRTPSAAPPGQSQAVARSASLPNHFEFLREWGSKGEENGEFSAPWDVAVGAHGQIYVTDNALSRIQAFDTDGLFLKKWGIRGRKKRHFSHLGWLSVDSDGEVYVSDKRKVHVFDAEGRFLRNWRDGGTDGVGGNLSATGLAVDANRYLYVADELWHQIRVYNDQGKQVASWGSKGRGEGNFDHPTGLALGAESHLYVVDSGNSRIQVFTTEGQFLRGWGSEGSGNGQFRNPKGVAVEKAGKVYVADQGNCRIQVFNSKGRFITKLGSEGIAEGEFSLIHGIAVEENGNVYVADTGNFRVQVFRPSVMSGS